MTAGFHFKLIGRDASGNAVWEPDSSNRVWSPGDGDSLWLKSGQVSVRRQPLDLTAMPVEVLYPAAMTPPPELILVDEVDDFQQTFPAVSSARFPGGPPFRDGALLDPDLPGRGLRRLGGHAGSTDPVSRPFPADPDDLSATSRFALDADGWLPAFPAAVTETLSIEPVSPSSFPARAEGRDRASATARRIRRVAAVRRPGGKLGGPGHGPVDRRRTGSASLPARPEGAPALPAPPRTTTGSIPGGPSRRPPSPTTYYTREGVYGVAARGPTAVAEPPSRDAMMRAAFGDRVVQAGVFASREMPHGATTVGTDVSSSARSRTPPGPAWSWSNRTGLRRSSAVVRSR